MNKQETQTEHKSAFSCASRSRSGLKRKTESYEKEGKGAGKIRTREKREGGVCDQRRICRSLSPPTHVDLCRVTWCHAQRCRRDKRGVVTNDPVLRRHDCTRQYKTPQDGRRVVTNDPVLRWHDSTTVQDDLSWPLTMPSAPTPCCVQYIIGSNSTGRWGTVAPAAKNLWGAMSRFLLAQRFENIK